MIRARLDLDAVIVNCAKGIAESLGVAYPKDIIEDGFGYSFKNSGTVDSIYSTFSKEQFWSGLDKFSWSDRLISLFEREFGDNWIFLTKGTDSPNSFSGKVKWIQKHYPQHEDKLWICRRNKHHACGSRWDLLVDDNRQNCEDWISWGGSAFQWVEMTEVTTQGRINERLESLEKYIKELKKKHDANPK